MNSRLDYLEPRIMEAHRAALDAEKTTEDRRIEAGKYLIEARLECNHGEWLAWLRRIGLPQRTARYYMSLAKEPQPQVGKSAKTPRGLPISARSMQNLSQKHTAQAAQVEKVRSALIADPTKTNDVIKKETSSSNGTVSRERANLVKEGLIPDQGRARGPLKDWKPAPRSLLKTEGTLRVMVAYLNEIYKKTSAADNETLINPQTREDINVRDGILDALDKIQLMADAISARYRKTNKLRLVASNE